MKVNMQFLNRKLFWLLAACLAIPVYFSSNIWGYYRFKQMCSKEGGLKIIEPLEKGVGWRARTECSDCKEGYRDQNHYPTLNGIAFLRFQDEKNGELTDMVLIPPSQPRGQYTEKRNPADLSKAVVYEYRDIRKKLKDEIRLNSSEFQVVDLRSGKIVVTNKNFSYNFTSYVWGVGGGGCSQVLNTEPISDSEALTKAFKIN
jgi:hypothetical protein